MSRRLSRDVDRLDTIVEEETWKVIETPCGKPGWRRNRHTLVVMQEPFLDRVDIGECSSRNVNPVIDIDVPCRGSTNVNLPYNWESGPNAHVVTMQRIQTFKGGAPGATAVVPIPALVNDSVPLAFIDSTVSPLANPANMELLTEGRVLKRT
jgi:hypothetical protein